MYFNGHAPNWSMVLLGRLVESGDLQETYLVKLMTHLVEMTTPDDPQYFVSIKV